MPNLAPQLGQEIDPVGETPRCAAAESVQQRKPCPPRPEGGYQQQAVALLEDPLQYLMNERDRWKGIEETLWPIVGESILAQRAGLLCQGEPEGAMGRLLCGKEVYLCHAEDIPDVEHHLWMEPPLPRWRLATGQEVCSLVPSPRQIYCPHAG